MSVKWELYLGKNARKALAHFPDRDRLRIHSALGDMSEDPYSGDIEKIAGEMRIWRRRVGSYRILYEIDAVKKHIEILDVRRRTTATY